MWESLTSVAAFDACLNAHDPTFSHTIIFKHSTRCSISSMAKSRLEKQPDSRARYLLVDVIADRQLSNHIAGYFNVRHESPQVFLLQLNELLDVRSHMAIRPDALSSLMDAQAPK